MKKFLVCVAVQILVLVANAATVVFSNNSTVPARVRLAHSDTSTYLTLPAPANSVVSLRVPNEVGGTTAVETLTAGTVTAVTGSPTSVDYVDGRVEVFALNANAGGYAHFQHSEIGPWDMSNQAAVLGWQGFTIGMIISVLPGTVWIIFRVLKRGIKLTNE